jgi:hypothetical protein
LCLCHLKAANAADLQTNKQRESSTSPAGIEAKL